MIVEPKTYYIEKVIQKKKEGDRIMLYVKWKGFPDKFNSYVFLKRDRIMIYVTLPSNNSMDIYPNNKISSFKVNLPETLQLDQEH